MIYDLFLSNYDLSHLAPNGVQGFLECLDQFSGFFGIELTFGFRTQRKISNNIC